MKKRKGIKAMAAAAVAGALFAASFSSGQAASFSDVSSQYKDAVTYVTDQNIASGLGDGTFGVTQKIKRVDAAVMLAKALNLDLEAASSSTFKDVPARAQKAVSALAKAGIVSGKSSALFGADQTLTRGEMALILVRAYKLQGTADHQFKDVSSVYDAAVQALTANKVTLGKSPSSFGTTLPITRGEFAVFLYRVDGNEDTVPGDFEVIDIY
ncbi:S-layer homology domain-containing protein [Domibacillus indicus]|uniref:S-layer homology domain-containing protein n=1 Tax=Domibacillus indicus TaxID=1437523 RepID=UPI000698F420|nr:S-layer homology domain-containing protein [Domibacillus indicus]